MSSTGWEYRIGYRVERNRTNKKGLCSRLQGFIRVEKIAPGMVHSAADPILAFYRRDAEEDIGTDKKSFEASASRRWNLVFWVRSMK